MTDELYHYGVKGMKWGVRRYQNDDGSYTDKGKARRRIGGKKELTEYGKEYLTKDPNGNPKNDAIISAVPAAVPAYYGYKLARQSKMGRSKAALAGLGLGALSFGINMTSRKLGRKASMAIHDIVNRDPNGKFYKDRVGAYKINKDGSIAPNRKVSKVTRNVINDYNTMGDKDFFNKYKASRKTYLKRLSKHDDPYMHAKNSGWYKVAKKIVNANTSFNRARKRALQNPKTRARLENWEEPYEIERKNKKSVKHSERGNNMYYTYPDELYHYGVKGQRWGVRRYQNADGSLTDAGRSHYGQRYTGSGRRTRRAGSYDENGRRINWKKVAAVGAGVAGTAALGVYAARHPGKVRNIVSYGKQYAKDARNAVSKLNVGGRLSTAAGNAGRYVSSGARYVRQKGGAMAYDAGRAIGRGYSRARNAVSKLNVGGRLSTAAGNAGRYVSSGARYVRQKGGAMAYDAGRAIKRIPGSIAKGARTVGRQARSAAGTLTYGVRKRVRRAAWR